MLKGSPVNKEIQERCVQVGFTALLCLMGFVFVNDLVQLWQSHQPVIETEAAVPVKKTP
jgi:hypothetical protein